MKYRVAVYLSLVAVIVGLSAADAQATPPTPEVEADYAAAVAWWGGPSTQCTTITLEMQPTDFEGEGKTARATQPRPGEIVACTIWIFEDKWSAESTCEREMVLRHEVGHTRGLGHDETDPASIMAPTISAEAWCGEDPPATESTTSSQQPLTSGEATAGATEQTMVQRELATARQRCTRMRLGTGRAKRCWGWARQLRREYRALAG